MSELFGNLTYNNKVIKPALKPVQAIASMYDTQSKNYEYAVDNYNKSQTLLSGITTDNNTKHVVQGAQKVLDEELANVAEKGDYENYALASKQLGYDLANKHGLSAVQKYNDQKQAYLDSINEMEGVSAERKRQYIRDAERSTRPLEYDEELKRWQGSYTGRQAVAQTDWAKELVELTKGFKADTLPFQTKDGQLIVRNAEGTGYVYSSTGEAVSEQELEQFAKTYLASNPNFQSELQEDIYFDLSNKLYDEETGSMRAMTASDIETTFPPGYIQHGKEMFGLGKGKLEKELESKGIAPEQFYSALKAEEKMRLATLPAVYKEGYQKIENDFLKLPENDGANDWTNFNQGIVDTYNVEDRTTADDLKNSSVVYANASTKLEQAKTELTEIERSNSSNPYIIEEKKKEIAEQERILNATIDKHSKNIEAVPEVKEKIQKIVSGNSYIQGVDISFGAMQKLIYETMAGKDITAQLEQYVTVPTEEEQIENLENKSILRPINKMKANWKHGVNARGKAITHLKTAVKDIADELMSKAEEGEMTYTQSYASWNLADMDPKTERNHPAYQLEHSASNMSKKSSAFYRKMVHPGGLDVETYLANQYDLDLEDEDQIMWQDAIVDASIDTAKGTDGVNKPTVLMQVPIKQGEKTTMVNVQAFVDEPSYNAQYFETITTLKNQLVEKKNTVGLKPTEQITLDRYNANLFDTSKYGTTFPTTKLYNATDGEVVEFGFMDGAEKAKVKVATTGSPNGFTYLLMDDSEGEEKYYATDRQGNQHLVTKEQLQPNARGVAEYTPIGGNTPYDLRVLMGEMTSNLQANNQDSSFGDVDTVDLTSIFKTDIKEGVTPKIAKRVAPYAQRLKEEFPGLIVTDALRPNNASYGAENSRHKVGEALDLRRNEDAEKLLQLSDREKRLLGIKSVGLHNDNHIHLEFI